MSKTTKIKLKKGKKKFLNSNLLNYFKLKNLASIFLFFFIILFLSGCFISVKNSGSTRDGGIYISPDKGESWVQRVLVTSIAQEERSIAAVNVVSMVFDPQDYHTFYVGTDGNGLFYTYDDGVSWRETPGLSAGRIESVAVDPESKCIIYASSGNRIFKSNDCSRYWQEIYIDDRSDQVIQYLAIDDFEPSVIYAGTSRGDFLRSNDYGESWATIKRFDNRIKKILIDPNDTRIVYIATEGRGIFKTIDKGGSWIDLNEGLKEYPGSSTYRSLIFDLSQKNSLILASQYGILRSFDAGESWEAIDLMTPPGSTVIYSVAVNPQNNQEIYYGTASTFYKTVDGGANWITKRLPTARAATSLLVNPMDPYIVYMGVTGFEK